MRPKYCYRFVCDCVQVCCVGMEVVLYILLAQRMTIGRKVARKKKKKRPVAIDSRYINNLYVEK